MEGHAFKMIFKCLC